MPQSANAISAPIAHKAPGADPYVWLQERDTDAVLDYLKAENAYQEAQTADQAELRESLFEEIKGRILETDLSLPSPWGPYLYYTRTTAGDEYARHYRCPRPADDSLSLDESREQLLLDPNVLANGGFFSLGAFSISPDHQRLAYSVDASGDEIYTLFVKELANDKVSELEFEDCDGSMTWANDSLTLFFGVLDDTHRPHKLFRYRLDGCIATAPAPNSSCSCRWAARLPAKSGRSTPTSRTCRSPAWRHGSRIMNMMSITACSMACGHGLSAPTVTASTTRCIRRRTPAPRRPKPTGRT
jgi:oligopeptidase B